jgi:protein-tyrosine phosphatase
MSGFIDLHLHIVPSVDDGVRTLQESLTVCRGLKALGFEHLVTTPHIRGGMFENRKAGLTQAFQAFKAQVADEPDMPALSLSAEHHCDELFLQLFQAGELLPYPGGRALLLEFANESFPLGIEELTFKLRLKGLTPVVAHPERYVPLFKRTDPIDRLLEQEVAFQLDVMALVGKYGRNARHAAERMLEEGVYAIAASDCHRPDDLERTREAIERLVELVGKAEAQLLLGENPARLLAGKAIQ